MACSVGGFLVCRSLTQLPSLTHNRIFLGLRRGPGQLEALSQIDRRHYARAVLDHSFDPVRRSRNRLRLLVLDNALDGEDVGRESVGPDFERYDLNRLV